MKTGRPSKYDPEMCDKVLEYLRTKKDAKDGDRIKVNLPTMQGLARFIGVNKTTLYEWAKVNEEFSNSLDEVKAEQHDRLLNSGLSGDYNSTIAKLVLSHNHEYSERTDYTSKGKELSALTVTPERKEEIDNALDKM
jgi:hypothetical protein